MAEPAAGCLLRHSLHRRPGGEGPGRRRGGQQGRLPGHRRGRGRVQARAGHLAGRLRGIAVLGGRARRIAQPRHQGRPVRLLRRPERPARCDRGDWSKAKVQTCVIHLIRASMKYVSWKDRKKAAAAMRPVYTAVNEAAAKAALENLRRDFGKKSPGLVAAWDRAWDQFVPFLEFDSAIRKVIYTTNAIESVNFQLRKIIKNRGHFPGDDAAIKLLYLGIRNITGRHIDGDGLVLQRGERGTGTYGWKAAMNAFAVAFGDRVPV